jgi:hypothetical protein
LEDPDVDGRIILRWIFRKWDRGMDWIDMAQDWDRWRGPVNNEGVVLSFSGFDQMRCEQKRYHFKNMLEFRIHEFYYSCLKLFFF